MHVVQDMGPRGSDTFGITESRGRLIGVGQVNTEYAPEYSVTEGGGLNGWWGGLRGVLTDMSLTTSSPAWNLHSLASINIGSFGEGLRPAFAAQVT